MQHAIPVKQRPARRRNAGSPRPAQPGKDARYRRTANRRSAVVPATLPEAEWPQWVVPAALSSVMLSISVYHHAALWSAFRGLF